MLHIFYRDDDGSPLEITDFVNLSDGNFKTTTNAEQGSVGQNSFVIDDPLGQLNIVGHRRVWAMEDSAPVGMDMIFWGYLANRVIDRTDPPVETSRKWTANIVDVNSLLQRKVMAVSSSDRPAETDVERVQWLMTTGEAGFFDDTTTFIDTSNPVDMDAVDYNGQMFAQVLDDCAQQSGKNYYARFLYDSMTMDYRAAVWYGADGVSAAASDLKISNVIGDVTARVGEGDPGSGQAWVWEPSLDSSLNRDPARVFSAVYINYDGGHTSRTRFATIAEFANRDTIIAAPNIKTLAKANARGDRELETLHNEEDVISTTILVTPEHVNDAMAGDLITIRYSHMPGYQNVRQARILNRTVTWLTPEVYQIDYDLAPLPCVPGLVHHQQDGYGSASFIVPTVAPTPGNLMVMTCYIRNIGLGPSAIPGWIDSGQGVILTDDAGGHKTEVSVFYRRVQVGDSVWGSTGQAWIGDYTEWQGVGDLLTSVSAQDDGSLHIFCGGDITVGEAALIIGAETLTGINDTAIASTTERAPNTLLSHSVGAVGNAYWFTVYQITEGAGTFIADGDILGGLGISAGAGITVAFALDTDC